MFLILFGEIGFVGLVWILLIVGEVELLDSDFIFVIIGIDEGFVFGDDIVGFWGGWVVGFVGEFGMFVFFKFVTLINIFFV